MATGVYFKGTVLFGAVFYWRIGGVKVRIKEFGLKRVRVRVSSRVKLNKKIGIFKSVKMRQNKHIAPKSAAPERYRPYFRGVRRVLTPLHGGHWTGTPSYI